MSLSLNEDLTMLAESAGALLRAEAPVGTIRRLREAGQGHDPAIWRQMIDMGWPAAALPEAYGGLGFGYRGLGVLMEEMGRTVTAAPLFSSAFVAAPLILRGGSEAQKADLLPRLAAGALGLSLAVDETAHHAPDRIAMMARAEGGDYVLSGLKLFVPDVATADGFIVAARSEGGAGLLLLRVDRDAPGLEIEPLSLVDERSHGRLRFDAVQVPAQNLIGTAETGAAILGHALDIANIGLAAELYGIARQAHDLTVDYLKQRKQFGVLIGSFQALQHRASHMAAELEMALSSLRVALLAIDEEDPRLPLIASAVKVKLARVAHLVTAEAIQMHGGMGMTDEADIGFYLKRARVAQQLYGGRQYHADRYARLKGY
ncbi:MAG: acyl-CoA dehydrogenase family protein [Pseudodonghicola sp.]